MIEWTPVLVALIAAGLFKAVVDGVRHLYNRYKKKHDEATPDGRHAVLATTLDQSLAVVARARDELEADNVRLRAQMIEADARHEADRARWELRDKARREEIEVLERKLRALLAEVEKLKDRHTFDEIEASQTRIQSHSQYPGPQGS